MSRGRTKKRGSGGMDTSTDSQQMLALGELMKKPRGDQEQMKQFRTQVAKDKKDMKALLQRRLQQAQEEDTRRRTNLASLISRALQPSTDPTKRAAPTFANTTIAVNPTIESASKLSAACKSLVTEYKGFEATIAAMADDKQSHISEQWAQNVAETEKKLRLGHKVALRSVKKVLGAEEEENDADADDGEKEGEVMLMGKLDYELLQGLRYAERGVKRMVKGLPKDL